MPAMKPVSQNDSFELIACGLLLLVVGGLLHRADPTFDIRLPGVALVGGGACLAAGVLARWRRASLRWCAGLLFGLAGALGWQAWLAWEAHWAREGGYRPVPVMATTLSVVTCLLGVHLCSSGRDPK